MVRMVQEIGILDQAAVIGEAGGELEAFAARADDLDGEVVAGAGDLGAEDRGVGRARDFDVGGLGGEGGRR